MKTMLLWMGVLVLMVCVMPGKARAQSGITDRSSTGVTCASDDGKRHYCAVDTRGGVQLQKQRSDSPCIQGRTWGYDRRGVWVDRGCRAEFALGGRGNGWGNNNGGGWQGGNGNGNGWQGGNGGQQQAVTCSSDNGRRNRCRVDTRGGVQLVKQRSGSPCVQGQTWGYDRSGIWVDRGCRADFAVGR